MIPSERRWRGSLRLIKSRLSRFVIPGPPSAVRNLLLPHCRFLVATFLGMTKRINLDCDFRRLTFVIPNRLYRLRKKSASRRFAASGAKALAGFAPTYAALKRRSTTVQQAFVTFSAACSAVRNLLLASLPHPLVHPIVHRLVPKLGILRLEHPMTFVGEVEHLRRHAQPLQGREELKSL